MKNKTEDVEIEKENVEINRDIDIKFDLNAKSKDSKVLDFDFKNIEDGIEESFSEKEVSSPDAEIEQSDISDNTEEVTNSPSSESSKEESSVNNETNDENSKESDSNNQLNEKKEESSKKKDDDYSEEKKDDNTYSEGETTSNNNEKSNDVEKFNRNQNNFNTPNAPKNEQKDENNLNKGPKQPHVNNQNNNDNSKDIKSNNNKPVVRNAEKNHGDNHDVGARNLRGALGRAKSFLNRGKNKSNSKDESSSSSNKDDAPDKETSTSKNEDFLMQRIKRKIIKIAIIMIVLYILILTSIVFIISFLSFLGFNVSVSNLFGAQSYGTTSFQSAFEPGTSQYNNEIKYYKELNKIKTKYLNDNSVEININYINMLLLSYYNYADILIDIQDGKEQVDYSKMIDMANKMSDAISEEFGTSEIDYSVGGRLYTLFKNNNDVIDYYKKILEKEKIDDILTDVFDIASQLDNFEYSDETVLTNETTVSVPVSSSNEKPQATQTITKKLTINEYIADSIYASTDNISNGEIVKAYTIAYSTNIVSANNKLSISSNTASASNILCSTTEGCSYDSNSNLVSGPGERSNKNNIYYNGGYYYKKPLSSSEQADLTKNINTVFGNVLVNTDGTYPNLNSSLIVGLGDGDYKTILQGAYGDLKTKNVGENSYILDGSYGDKQVKTPVIFYDQKDYPGYSFCGLKSSTIAGSGCGVTSMAIVASTYENNRKYDPIYMNQEAQKKGMCGTGGTAQAFFQKEAKTMGYKFASGKKTSKSFLNLVLKHLAQGHLVVVNVKAGTFTGGGHYMVLGGVDPATQKVYVYDPNNRSNKSYRKSGSGWYSFNDVIVKEGYSFFIMWKG